MLNIRFRIATMLAFALAASTAVAQPCLNKPVKLVVPPSRNVNAVQELVAYAKANPAMANYVSIGSGTNGTYLSVRSTVFRQR